MKMIARAAYLPAVLVAATCLTLSACGQGGKGKKHSQPEQPANPFAGKTMAMKKEAYTFNMSVQDALIAFENEQEYALASINLYTYDNLGRLMREIIVTLPQSPASNIPSEGTIAYDMQFTYSSSEPWKEETAVQQLWDAWWDGASLAPQRTTTWTDSVEETTYFDTQNPGQIITSAAFDVREELNPKGYVIHATRQRVDTQVVESEEFLERAADGIQLDRIESVGETIEYDYYPNGALKTMDILAAGSGNREVTTYEYSVENGVYVIVAEARSYGPDGTEIGVRTALELFESGFCHEATRRRDTFQRPNLAPCRELANCQ